MRRIFIVFLILSLTMIVIAEEDKFNSERLPIGNPKSKYDFCAVKLNRIFDTNENTEVSIEQLMKQFKKYRIIMIGESHTAEQHHLVQLSIIKGLAEAGINVCFALEMFTKSQNEVLNRYIDGKITEEEFLDQSNYVTVWGHNYRYYKPIFDYAREKKIKMFGVNIEHDYASKIGRGGLEALLLAERESIPELDTTNVEHRFYIKVTMEGMDATMPAQFKKIYAAQSLWDAAMGDGVIKVAAENPESIVVLLAGSGHVAYNLGIGKIIKNRSEFPFASVISIDVPDMVQESVMMKVKKSIQTEKKEPEKKESARQEKKMPAMTATGEMDATPYKIVIRSYADFLWGVPEERQEKYPSLGFSIDDKNEQGFLVKRVIPETIAEQKGIQKGDIILSIDGKYFSNMTQLKKYLSYKNWHDSISFKILRDQEEVEINFVIEPQ